MPKKSLGEISLILKLSKEDSKLKNWNKKSFNLIPLETLSMLMNQTVKKKKKTIKNKMRPNL